MLVWLHLVGTASGWCCLGEESGEPTGTTSHCLIRSLLLAGCGNSVRHLALLIGSLWGSLPGWCHVGLEFLLATWPCWRHERKMVFLFMSGYSKLGDHQDDFLFGVPLSSRSFDSREQSSWGLFCLYIDDIMFLQDPFLDIWPRASQLHRSSSPKGLASLLSFPLWVSLCCCAPSKIFSYKREQE